MNRSAYYQDMKGSRPINAANTDFELRACGDPISEESTAIRVFASICGRTGFVKFEAPTSSTNSAPR